MGRQAWKKGAFLTVSLLSAAFFGRLERISRTVYLGETEEQELVRKTETEKEPPETAVETIIETETEETEKQTEVKKETGRIRVLIRSDDFAELSQTSGEGSLWQAIDTFGAEWDIEASDFPAMFARAMQGAADQLDNPAVQPVAGLKLLMMRDSEVELVRECFRWLYNDEDDDLKKRRGRAEMFADQITGRFRRCFPRMNKYTMTPAHAVYFLNLWMPEENFFYIPAEAKAWADFMEYPAEFGNGASLDLAAYYAMCEDLVTALADYPDLIAQHKERLRTHLGGINDRLHLLAYDILHAAYQRGYYPKGFSRNATAKERAKAVKEKQTRAELCLQIAEKEQELQELQAAPVALPDLTGCRIVHKMFGAGTVLPGEGQFMVIDFNGTQKKFSYTASLSSGYLTAEDDSVMQQMQDYQNYGKTCDALQKELKNLKDELVKL